MLFLQFLTGVIKRDADYQVTSVYSQVYHFPYLYIKHLIRICSYSKKIKTLPNNVSHSTTINNHQQSSLLPSYLTQTCHRICWVQLGGGMGLCAAHCSVASHVRSVGSFKATSDPLITSHVHGGTSEQCLRCCGSHYAVGGGPVLLGVALVYSNGLDSCLEGCCVKVTST